MQPGSHRSPLWIHPWPIFMIWFEVVTVLASFDLIWFLTLVSFEPNFFKRNCESHTIFYNLLLFYNLYVKLIRKKPTFRSLFIVCNFGYYLEFFFFISKIMYGRQFLPLFRFIDDILCICCCKLLSDLPSIMDVPLQIVRYVIDLFS